MSMSEKPSLVEQIEFGMVYSDNMAEHLKAEDAIHSMGGVPLESERHELPCGKIMMARTYRMPDGREVSACYPYDQSAAMNLLKSLLGGSSQENS